MYYALYFDANLRQEEFDRCGVESQLDGRIVKTVFARRTHLADLANGDLIRYFNNHFQQLTNFYHDKSIKGYFITLDKGIFTQVWMDLILDNDLELELIEFVIPAKIRTQKRKHWHDRQLQETDIPKVRGYIKDQILHHME